MKRLDRLVAAVGLAVIAISPMAAADEVVLKALTQGGHAILVRHAKIGGHTKALVLDLGGNCANEENLSAEGRAQAIRLKSMVDKLGIVFDQVLTSPYCRAKDTAQLAFGRATVEPNLLALENGTQEQGQERTKAITELLTRHAGKGNVALISHRPNIDAITLELVEEGEAVVARIQFNGELDVIGRIAP